MRSSGQIMHLTKIVFLLSIDSEMDPFFGQAHSKSIQDMRGSFCKLQNSYSVYFLHDSSQTIREGKQFIFYDKLMFYVFNVYKRKVL